MGSLQKEEHKSKARLEVLLNLAVLICKNFAFDVTFRLGEAEQIQLFFSPLETSTDDIFWIHVTNP